MQRRIDLENTRVGKIIQSLRSIQQLSARRDQLYEEKRRINRFFGGFESHSTEVARAIRRMKNHIEFDIENVSSAINLVNTELEVFQRAITRARADQRHEGKRWTGEYWEYDTNNQ